VTLEDIEAALPVIEKHINSISGIGEIGLDLKTLSNTFHSNSWSTIECMHQNISCTKFFKSGYGRTPR
jgi:Tat protein secretion system quality control protein TatD with DNase activity